MADFLPLTEDKRRAPTRSASVRRRGKSTAQARKQAKEIGRQEGDTAALVAALESERAELGHALHSTVGQQVTALLLGLKEFERPLKGHASAVTLRSLQAIADDLGRELHRLALALHPSSLKELGLVRCLTAFMEDKFRDGRTAVEFDHAEWGASRPPEKIERALYQVLCEALLNTVRHAGACRVAVVLRRRRRRLVGIVEDDGVGFDAKMTGSRGLQTMRGRAALVGGDVAVESSPGKGTTVIVRLPLSTFATHG